MNIYDQQTLLKDLAKHPGVKIFVDIMTQVVEKTKEKQLQLDPYKYADEIMRCKQLIFLVEEEIPKIVESIINYDPATLDKLVAPKKRWYFWKVFDKSR